MFPCPNFGRVVKGKARTEVERKWPCDKVKKIQQ